MIQDENVKMQDEQATPAGSPESNEGGAPQMPQPADVPGGGEQGDGGVDATPAPGDAPAPAEGAPVAPADGGDENATPAA